MRGPTESYLKVFYDLRPAKQIERKMIVDTLLRMSQSGFRIADYQYTGFGSVYFIDFVLLHKVLGIKNLLNVEYSKAIKKRVTFNSPFGIIRHEFKPVSDVIPTLSRDLRHILWLDYDDIINRGVIEDVIAASAQLSPGSLLLITVDVEPPSRSDEPDKWREFYEEEVGQFLDPGLSATHFARSNLPQLNASMIFNAVKGGLVGRSDVSWSLVFNFLYKDGHRMLTLGGLIGSVSEARNLAGCDFDGLGFIRSDIRKKPYEIRVPRLTKKERLYLDSHMPCPDNWKPREFEITTEDVEAYREIYRFYPSFAELLL
jgi:hypothetical protein